MTHELPESLTPFKAKAKKIVAQNLVRDIEFSRSTYQVHVEDLNTHRDLWVFLHLNDRGNIKDAFCSCDQTDETLHCEHIAAAYLSIYNDTSCPLHVRFQKSLWNQLCQLYFDGIGDSQNLLEKVSPGYYRHISIGDKEVFFIRALSDDAQDQLEVLMEHRAKETEETSLKFSNLPSEEVKLWKQGKPSPQLRYELSYWSDIAHLLMTLQEKNKPYKISFEYSPKKIPNYVFIHFDDLELGFYLSTANLPLVIPSLTTVESPIRIHNYAKENIESISYHKKTGKLEIIPKTKSVKRKASEAVQGTEIDGWKYVENDGFYPCGPQELLEKKELEGEEIAHLFKENFQVVKSLLQGTTLHSEPIKLSYTLTFDSRWNFHIQAYAFTPGDLNSSYSKLFGRWVYVDNKGFFPIGDAHFNTLETVIPADAVGDFILRERSWLNTQEGYQSHLTNVETQLAYAVTSENSLKIYQKVEEKQQKGSKDFGEWIYVVGSGFYAKTNTYFGFSLRPDMLIPKEQVSFFIRMNKQELVLIPNFFSANCPVSKSRLHISLMEDHSIMVIPEYDILKSYAEKNVRFFNDYAFVEGEGFHELPIHSKLPENFRHPVHIDAENVPLFLEFELDNLKPFISQIDPRLVRPTQYQLYAESIKRTESSKIGLYSLVLDYHTGHGLVSLEEIATAIKQKKPVLFTEAGAILLADKRFNWVRQLRKNQWDKHTNSITLSLLELIKLHALENIIVPPDAYGADISQGLLSELEDFQVPEEPNLTGLKSQLREYQDLGLRWLWFLYHHSLSGILCDEMGLGKTHQAMALLASVKNDKVQKKEGGVRFLIICPTSVIYHWQEKLEEFFPELNVMTFHGSQRNQEQFKDDFDVLLTSYGIWRIEYERLSQLAFDIAIFDEIQIAKNSHSRVHMALRHVNARMRLGMTGTPIENHLRELKALFDLVLPTYMPSEAEFRELFVKPIEKENNPERNKLLTRFIKPFVLRRKKMDVLKDLPEKIEEIAHCELTLEQQIYYMQTLSQSRDRLLDQLKSGSNNVPYIHIFALLSSLKQICDHPAVFLKSPSEYKKYSSGKWELFLELLNEARDSGQKVVIFSQYLAMLDIFEEYLNESGIAYATIRGATTNRGDQIYKFNHDPNCEVFLGSLQAAGLGVDLTAGSVVIHYDRWWNAARENQATDRVHRIGQTRGVQVFKLVTKGTFEERIDEIIRKKGKLMEEVVSPDDHRFMKMFTRSELIELLEDINVTDSK